MTKLIYALTQFYCNFYKGKKNIDLVVFMSCKLAFQCSKLPNTSSNIYKCIFITILNNHVFSGFHAFTSQVVLVVVKNLPVNRGDIRDVVLIPGSGRSPGGAWQCTLVFLLGKSLWAEVSGAIVFSITQSWAQLK